MKNKDLKKLFLQETAKIDIIMSEKLKNTPIQSPKQDVQDFRPKKNMNWLKLFLPITATACIIVLLFSFILPIRSTTSNSYLTAYILEINPSFAFVTDEEDNIINICSVNEDADEILNNDEFNDITNMTLSEAVEKVIKITSEEGIFDEYTDTIKIYALNDNEKEIDSKLEKFGGFIQRDLREFVHSEIDFEKSPMKLDFFREKLGFDRDFNRLDDMRDYIKMHDRFKGEFPPPPPPSGDEFTPPPAE